jgi:hypothetical protein
MAKFSLNSHNSDKGHGLRRVLFLVIGLSLAFPAIVVGSAWVTLIYVVGFAIGANREFRADSIYSGSYPHALK